MSAMTPERLAQMRALVDAATDGPWEVLAEPHPDYPVAVERRIITTWHHPQLKGPVGVVNHATVVDGKMQVSIDAADAEFIAAARSFVPDALAEIERLAGENDRIATECGRLGAAIHKVTDENITLDDEYRTLQAQLARAAADFRVELARRAKKETR
jgi:hypothetical protein